ncbi:hypothetical protein GGI15_003571 [Coemansia interrupta]|uniref:FAD/NAD(P)-binding domain-containing protein n=1 Tax=Coemansia interrupta TaxID=1126814 RepID=A0A9W8LG79_9FUNG|nr:hypothetical protein GGI15_003571 [Coemansia interrupta]
MPPHIAATTTGSNAAIGQRSPHGQSQDHAHIPSYTGYSLIQNHAPAQQQTPESTHSLHSTQSHHQIKLQNRNRGGEPLSPPLSAGHTKTTFQNDLLQDPLSIERPRGTLSPYHHESNGSPYPSIATADELRHMNLARTSKIFHVVIVGGAFAGIRAAQELEQLVPPHIITITVVEKRDQYFYNLGALRAMVKPELIDMVWLPYDNIFKYPHNRVIKGEVTAVYPNSVILKGGNKIDFDSLLVSIGSVYPQPCKVDTSSHIHGKAEMRMYAEIVREAESILIIGGGPTGVGLAAEIATEFTHKTVILVHSGPRLMQSENTSDSMSRKALKKLKALGVKVFLNERVIIPDDEPLTYRIECRWLKTSKGRMLFSNFQVLCNGISFNTSMMHTLDPMLHNKVIDDKTGQIQVRPTMQINHPHLPWIFAAGDVCNTAGEKQAYRADSQGGHVARCMARMAHAWAQGNPQWYDVALKPWHDPAQFMAVAMGPSSGITDTPWIVLGDLPTRIMKSRELFLQRRYREFNLDFPGVPKRKASDSNAGQSRIGRDDDRFIRNVDESVKARPREVQASQSLLHMHEQHRQQHMPLSAAGAAAHGQRILRSSGSASADQRIGVRGGVATNIDTPVYDLTKAMAQTAIATADHLDGQYDNDRVSLSRPDLRQNSAVTDAFPYAAFYGGNHHPSTSNTTDSELSEGYTSEDVDNVNRIIREANERTGYGDSTTPPPSTLESAAATTAAGSDGSIDVHSASDKDRSRRADNMSLGHYSQSSNPSKMSVATASTADSSSSGSSRITGYTATLKNGPVIPRNHRRRERSIFSATRRLFRSRDTIREEDESKEQSVPPRAMVLPRMSSVMSSSVPKRSNSNLTINLQQI